MSTLYLTPKWDLCVDNSGNIALATEPYALAQDVASAIKLFKGELWYDAQKGVPYFEKILGKRPPAALFRHHMEKGSPPHRRLRKGFSLTLRTLSCSPPHRRLRKNR